MKAIFVVLPIITTLLLGSLLFPSSFAQFSSSGGVDKDGTWHAGEGLKQGDFFSYTMCHVDYKECTEFELDMWIKGDRQVGSETKWLAEVVVYDGKKRIVGEMELGKVAPEPTGGSPELGLYRGAFKSSVAWLSAFATADGSHGGKGPKEFRAASWGKIGNIGGEQVVPLDLQTVTVPAGTWDTVLVGWKTGGALSKVWIVDDFPFPIKAHTLTHVSEGIPPPEYKFELREYRENVQQTPFAGIVSTADEFLAQGCDTNIERDIAIKKPTNNFDYQIHAFYGPEDPVEGCEMQWLIKFISKYDDTEFLNQVQFDFFVVDDNLSPIRSIAQEEGRDFLYSPSGQYILDMIVKENPGTANYVVWVYGLAPEGIVPSTASDYLEIPITIYAGDGSSPPITPPVIPPPPTGVPSWIKTSSGFWVDGNSSDGEFISAIQFLIKEGIIQIPPTTQGSSSAAEVPSWIKTTVGFWVDGNSSDNEFISAMQFLIKEGIMTISS